MFKNFMKNEEGQGMVEYGLIIALVAIVIIGALKLLGQGVSDIFDSATEGLEGATDENAGGGNNGGGDNNGN